VLSPIFISMKLSVLFEEVMNEITNGGYIAYHGSTNKIEKFVDDFVGGEEATDQEGPGIYFTTSYDDALGYGNYVYKVRIKDGKFLDDKTPSDSVDVEELVTLIKQAEDWELNAQDWAEDPEHGAYEAAHSAIEYNETERDVFQQIWISFYRYEPVPFVRNMVKLGYDGIVIDAYRTSENNNKHIIVYNPNIIEYLGLEKAQ